MHAESIYYAMASQFFKLKNVLWSFDSLQRYFSFKEMTNKPPTSMLQSDKLYSEIEKQKYKISD